MADPFPLAGFLINFVSEFWGVLLIEKEEGNSEKIIYQMTGLIWAGLVAGSYVEEQCWPRKINFR